jgi:hypothetical protein
MAKKTKIQLLPKRNNSLFDGWSIVHFSSGVALGWVLPPFLALALMVVYEPFEIFILSPVLERFGIIFGYEGLRNSLSDIVFDTAGVATGAFILAKLVAPPFSLF